MHLQWGDLAIFGKTERESGRLTIYGGELTYKAKSVLKYAAYNSKAKEALKYFNNSKNLDTLNYCYNYSKIWIMGLFY